jgi:RsiW-degrading membrane proteinase PrsW (M82 family)
MTSSVRECISARQAGCPRTEFKLSALPQVSGALSHNLSGQDVFAIVLLALALVAAVVLTAIWSRDKDRRKDARDVLDRFLRWRW